jgi:hypothetical protein
MDSQEPTTVSITLNLTTDEAQDLAVLLPRLNVTHLQRVAWRSTGDTDVTVARWGVVLKRLADELARAGYPAVREV